MICSNKLTENDELEVYGLKTLRLVAALRTEGLVRPRGWNRWRYLGFFKIL